MTVYIKDQDIQDLVQSLFVEGDYFSVLVQENPSCRSIFFVDGELDIPGLSREECCKGILACRQAFTTGQVAERLRKFNELVGTRRPVVAATRPPRSLRRTTAALVAEGLISPTVYGED